MYKLYELITIDLRVIYELNVGVSRVVQELSKNAKSTLRVPYVLYDCTANRRSVLITKLRETLESQSENIAHIKDCPLGGRQSLYLQY